MDPVIEVRDLRKSYVVRRNLLGRPVESFTAVDGVSFDLKPGETVAVVGESGAGKSTVGRLLLRLIPPDSGTVRYAGTDLLAKNRREMRQLRGKLRLIFQDPFASLDPRMTIGDTLQEPLRLHTELSRSEIDARIIDLLERVGMREDHVDRYPYEFSGGQLQRVAIARAIATEPDVIVCDEPVAALDMSIRAQVINLLRDLQAERQLAYLFITHDLSLVRLIADRVLVMFQGQVVEAATADELFEDPRHPYTRELLAAVPVPDPARRKAARRQRLPVDPGLKTSTGCNYAGRCPDAVSECSVSAPQLTSGSNGTTVACSRAEDRDRPTDGLLGPVTR